MVIFDLELCFKKRSVNCREFMILKKVIIGFFYICLLNGCVQSTALLGPAYTLVNTGNVYHAGLSYGSNHAIKKITGKTTTENIKKLVINQKTKLKKEAISEEEENYDNFFTLVQRQINKTRKILNFTNQ